MEYPGDQKPSPDAPPRRKGGGSKEDVGREAIAKSWGIGVIERKEVKGDQPIEYFLSTGARRTF